MELFGLSIPDAVATAATVVYWLAVAVGLLVCVKKGYLWGKWRWFLLASCGAFIVSSLLKTATVVPGIFITLAGVFLLGKWRKVTFSPLEWLLMTIFACPVLMAMFFALLVIWVEVFRLPL